MRIITLNIICAGELSFILSHFLDCFFFVHIEPYKITEETIPLRIAGKYELTQETLYFSQDG